MTIPYIQQAKEWANGALNDDPFPPYEGVAARVIQSLPDHIIDAKELRELVVKYEAFAEDAEPEGEKGRIRAALYRNFVGVLEALLTPALPTLADMTPEERGRCLWMQVDLSSHLPGAVLTDPGGHDSKPRVMYQDGSTFTVEHEDVTPLPGEPKLGWPGDDDDHESEYCPVCGATLLDDGPECEHCREDAALPRPEDVPAGEPWIVLCGGKKWVGVRPADSEYVPWSAIRMDGLDHQGISDSEITLVSRLVPEVGA